MEFDTYRLIDLLDDSRPWEFVFGTDLDHFEPQQVHFHVETCSYFQLLVTAQKQYISVITFYRV
jgi:hypothetical protein